MRSRSPWSGRGLPQIRVHDLRHTTAIVLLEAGAHPKLVQDLLGHSTVTLTLDTYSHVTPAMHQDLTRRLDAAIAAAAMPTTRQLVGSTE